MTHLALRCSSIERVVAILRREETCDGWGPTVTQRGFPWALYSVVRAQLAHYAHLEVT